MIFKINLTRTKSPSLILIDKFNKLYQTINGDKYNDEYINIHFINPKTNKVIGSTNKQLNLPKIPQPFIEYFIENFNNGINITQIEFGKDISFE